MLSFLLVFSLSIVGQSQPHYVTSELEPEEPILRKYYDLLSEVEYKVEEIYNDLIRQQQYIVNEGKEDTTEWARSIVTEMNEFNFLNHLEKNTSLNCTEKVQNSIMPTSENMGPDVIQEMMKNLEECTYKSSEQTILNIKKSLRDVKNDKAQLSNPETIKKILWCQTEDCSAQETIDIRVKSMLGRIFLSQKVDFLKDESAHAKWEMQNCHTKLMDEFEKPLFHSTLVKMAECVNEGKPYHKKLLL